MIRKIVSQLRMRYLNLRSQGTVQELTDEERLILALKWFQQTLLPGGGSAAKYSMMFNKWFPSYPETTAFWINTLIYLQREKKEIFSSVFGNQPIIEDLIKWLLTTQRKDGTFPGSYGDFKNQPPRVFNNGQIIFALTDYYQHFGNEKCLEAAKQSADWILRVQDNDGAWRQFTLNQLSSNTRTAWALIKLGMLTGEKKYIQSGKANINFAITLQDKNDYFVSNGFDENEIPSTHTIGYALRGIVGAGIDLNDDHWINTVERAFKRIMPLVKEDGYLTGELDEEWKSDAAFCCLPGNCQLSVVGFVLASHTQQKEYAVTASKLLSYVKEKQLLSHSPMVNGGISGSWPVSGGYCAYDIPNWASRFFVDALILEEQFKNRQEKQPEQN
ncbi:MAG: glycoside hydrolase family 127 protein [Bacteroidetes bacterium]|jgi:hypothetical protein|nr:glycoside hydrolase family 127 protein [Bacteroidota bacterium]